MTEFIRARSSGQKDMRMAEIKAAADILFAQRPYHEITLTSIAVQLSWPRANLYKYVCTKEEIFLELCAEKRDCYYDALKAAFPKGCGYSLEVCAEVWACILNAHRQFLRYSGILCAIIETNVSLERLADFKRRYAQEMNGILDMLSKNLCISEQEARELYQEVYYHAVGLNSSCENNPLMQQAMEYAGIAGEKIDFRDNMKKFIYRSLKDYCKISRCSCEQ